MEGQTSETFQKDPKAPVDHLSWSILWTDSEGVEQCYDLIRYHLRTFSKKQHKKQLVVGKRSSMGLTLMSLNDAILPPKIEFQNFNFSNFENGVWSAAGSPTASAGWGDSANSSTVDRRPTAWSQCLRRKSTLQEFESKTENQLETHWNSLNKRVEGWFAGFEVVWASQTGPASTQGLLRSWLTESGECSRTCSNSGSDREYTGFKAESTVEISQKNNRTLQLKFEEKGVF